LIRFDRLLVASGIGSRNPFGFPGGGKRRARGSPGLDESGNVGIAVYFGLPDPVVPGVEGVIIALSIIFDFDRLANARTRLVPALHFGNRFPAYNLIERDMHAESGV